MNKTYIIAEMSANHCGDKELAKKIIKSAKDCGANAVKVQTYTANTMTIDCHNEEFQIKDKSSLWNGENYLYFAKNRLCAKIVHSLFLYYKTYRDFTFSLLFNIFNR